MTIDNETSIRRFTTDKRRRSLGGGTVFLKRLLACLNNGRISIVLPSGRIIDHRAPLPGPEAVLVVRRWRAIFKFLTGGDLGFAEAYIDGDWSTPDLIAVIQLGASNLEHLDRMISGFLPMRFVNRLSHLLKANTRSGSRRNIAFHYDLGNDFYKLWLDPGMTYSAAIFDDPGQSLESAQAAKIERIADLLDVRDGAEVLEIGCGWGALARRLAQANMHVTGITLSTEQLAFARELVVREGLSERVNLRLQDYRDIEGSFDRIVSIEMLEAVGEEYWHAYFQTLRQRLKAGGTAVLQVITIDEKRFKGYRAGADFVQRYIFPGGMLPTKTIIAGHVAQAGLSIAGIESFGESYALTLAEWRRRFTANWPAIERLGFPPSFRRLWEYYLSYCEAGFRAGLLDVGLYCLKA